MRKAIPGITRRSIDPHAVALVEIGMVAVFAMIAMTLGSEFLLGLSG